MASGEKLVTTIIIPTKGRPEKLRRCITSLGKEYPIKVYATSPSDIPPELYKMDNVYIEFGNRSIVDAVNYLAKGCTGNILPSPDDIEFMPGAVRYAETMMKKYRNNAVVAFTVINMKCNDDAFVLVGGELIKERGYLFNEGFEHFYADTELGDYAKSKDKFYVCSKAQIKNYHPVVTKIFDETHNYRRSEKLEHDRKYYEQLESSRLLHR